MRSDERKRKEDFLEVLKIKAIVLRNVYLQTFSTKNSIFNLPKEQFIKSVNDFWAPWNA